jgi:hypothetical protein
MTTDISPILTSKSDKIKSSIDKIKDYNLNLKDNVNTLKETAGKYARKDINLNFLDRFTRFIYTNPYHLAKIEFIQYIMFVGLLYFYNPFNINTKYPAFSRLLILVVAFVYVLLFLFIKVKVDDGDDVDLIDPTEESILIKFIATIVFFILFMLSIKGIIWLFVNTSLVKIFRHLMSVAIVVGVLGIIYLCMKKTINQAKNAQGKSFLKLMLKVVMYVPCLVADMVEAIKFQMHLTTKPVWILMAGEAGLISAWFLLPYLFDKIINYSGQKLLKEPVNLNVQTTIGDFKNTKTINGEKLSLDQIYSNKVNARAMEKRKENGIDTLDNAPQNLYHCDPNVPKNKYLAWIYNKFKHGISLKINFSKHPQYSDYKIDRFSYKYALSAWFYINPQPPNTSSAYSVYTNILSYGKKVNIEYNGKLNSLRVMAALASKGADYVTTNAENAVSTTTLESAEDYTPGNTEGASDTFSSSLTNAFDSTATTQDNASTNYGMADYKTPAQVAAKASADKAANANNTSVEIYQTNDIMYQKWNNIVINYDGGNIDVFLNGVLVGSVSGAVPYMSFDTIIAGANNGIYGGICNINYYTDILSENTIKSNYKALRMKTMPFI